MRAVVTNPSWAPLQVFASRHLKLTQPTEAGALLSSLRQIAGTRRHREVSELRGLRSATESRLLISLCAGALPPAAAKTVAVK